MISASVDVDGADELGRELEAAAARVTPEASKVVERGANNIKRDMRADAKSNGHYKLFHLSITYDMHGELEAEIGPDKNRVQGALGNLLYFGRSTTAGVLDVNHGLRRETPRFELALADVVEDVLS